jgi:rhodanese-related sulfurtransferase
MQKTKSWAMVIVASLMVVFSGACAAGQEAVRLDKETLKSWLSDPQVVIVDVRYGKDWQDSQSKIKGAIRVDPNEVQTWAASLPKEKKIVLY